MLAWYREPPELLYEAVSTAGLFVDRVVAYDGAYKRWPNAKTRSTKEEVAAIKEAGREMDIETVVYQPRKLWDGQIQKRHNLLRYSAEGSSWVMPLDADWVIWCDGDEVRDELAKIKADVVNVRFYTPENPAKTVEQKAATEWHAAAEGTEHHLPLIFRALEDMRIETTHWGYSGMKRGTRVALWGNSGYYKQASDVTLSVPFLIEHRSLFRDIQHVRDNRAFCEDRVKIVKQTGQEDAIGAFA